jgi:hypothetical protein
MAIKMMSNAMTNQMSMVLKRSRSVPPIVGLCEGSLRKIALGGPPNTVNQGNQYQPSRDRMQKQQGRVHCSKRFSYKIFATTECLQDRMISVY